MKTNLLVIIMVIFCQMINAQIKVNNAGNVGIGNLNPSYKLDVEGTVRISNWTDVLIDWNTPSACYTPELFPESDWYLFIGKPNNKIGHLYVYDIDYTNLYKTSDGRLKEKITPITNSLEKLKHVNGVKYKLKSEYFKGVRDTVKKRYDKEYIGFIAQDLNKVLPDLVQVGDSGIMKVDYVSMIPIIVEALKEEDSIISVQNEQIKSLQKLIKSGNNLKSASVTSQNDTAVLTPKNTGISLNSTSILYPNNPNPFNSETTVKYCLDEHVRQATINIYDLTGYQIKSVLLTSKGSGSITINANELHPGIFIYNLMTDGQEVASRRMVLTQ